MPQRVLDRLIRLPELLQITGLSRATVYRLIEQRKFPASVQISANSKGWFASQVEAWMQSLRTADGPASGHDAGAARSKRSKRSPGRGR